MKLYIIIIIIIIVVVWLPMWRGNKKKEKKKEATPATLSPYGMHLSMYRETPECLAMERHNKKFQPPLQSSSR